MNTAVPESQELERGVALMRRVVLCTGSSPIRETTVSLPLSCSKVNDCRASLPAQRPACCATPGADNAARCQFWPPSDDSYNARFTPCPTATQTRPPLPQAVRYSAPSPCNPLPKTGTGKSTGCGASLAWVEGRTNSRYGLR